MSQVIDHHFGRAKDLPTLPVTPLEHLENSLIGASRVVPHGNRFMLVRIERLFMNGEPHLKSVSALWGVHPSRGLPGIQPVSERQ